MSDHILKTIRDFVAGKTSSTEFRQQLNAESSAFECFLSQDPNLDPSNYVQGSTFRFLMELDFAKLSGMLNAQGALANFMERNGITFVKTPKYTDLYQTILSAQPDWLGADPDYVYDHILPGTQSLSGSKLREWLEYEFRERFKFVSDKPLDWIQSPCWPINENGPMVFLGQIDVMHYFHDYATVYVFHDRKTNQCESIIQTF